MFSSTCHFTHSTFLLERYSVTNLERKSARVSIRERRYTRNYIPDGTGRLVRARRLLTVIGGGEKKRKLEVVVTRVLLRKYVPFEINK